MKTLARASRIVATALVFAVTASLYRNATLHHFYSFGAGVDAFWFASILWHNRPALVGPPCVNAGTFFTVHVSPILIAPMALSYARSGDFIAWFAWVLGALHGFTSAAFAHLVGLVAARAARLARFAAALSLALGLAFAGCSLQAVSVTLPHYEILAPGLLIAFLASLALRRRALSGVLFVALLLTREDMGLHAVAFLAPMVVVTRLRERRWLVPEMVFALAGLAYSLALFALMPRLTGASVSMFHEHYVGDPAFAQLSRVEALRRLRFFALQSGHIWGPLAALACAAAWRRDAITLLGALAVLPWIAIHTLLGIHTTVWTMAFYYPFPALVTVAWPSLVRLYRAGPLGLTGRDTAWLFAQCLTVAAASLPTMGRELPHYGDRYRPVRVTQPPAWRESADFQAFRAALRDHRAELGEVAATVAAVAIDPQTLQRHEWLDAPRDAESIDRLDTVLVFSQPYACPAFDAVMRRAKLTYAYTVPGSRVWLFTRVEPEAMPTFARVMRRAERPARVCHQPVP